MGTSCVKARGTCWAPVEVTLSGMACCALQIVMDCQPFSCKSNIGAVTGQEALGADRVNVFGL